MHSELFNLWLCARCIGRILFLTGIGPGMLWAILRATRTKFRIVKIGIEQVSGDGQLASPHDGGLLGRPSAESSWAGSPSRKVWRHA